MDELFRHLHIPPEIACQFLGVFSRMEYALKSTRYAKGGVKGVDPAWDEFANYINDEFLALSSQEIVEARNYLFDKPPRKQVLRGNRIMFIDQIIDNNQKPAQQLLLMVRTVRNNLFHGGKYLPEGETEAGRNHELVKHALNILLSCSKIDHEVRSSFER